MNEGRQNSVTRRGLIRGSALGAAGIGALAAPALFGSAPASAAVAPGLSWTNVVTDFGADPTGARDSTSNFQSAINAGLPVYVPPGTYLCSAGPLLVAPYTRIFGNSYGGTTITTTGAPLFNMDSVAGTGGNAPPPIEGIEIDHLTLSASSTGGDIFWGANIVRSSVHHCKLVQNNPASAIYNCSASTGQSPAGTTYMAECRFYFNTEAIQGSASRSINPWYLNSNGLLNLNDNWWFGNVLFNSAHDQNYFWYRIIGPATGQESRNNRFSKLTYEFPQGGMIKLESTTGDVIEDVTSEDLTNSLPVGNPLISISTVPGNSTGCAGITIRNYSRRGGGSTNPITDIQLDANARQITIDTPSQYGPGQTLVIDAGDAANVTLLGSPGAGNYTLRNGSGVKVLS